VLKGEELLERVARDVELLLELKLLRPVKRVRKGSD
jgi:hypothetical protein